MKGNDLMHVTNNVPGTSPVTDDPNPNNQVGSAPDAPGTDKGKPGDTEDKERERTEHGPVVPGMGELGEQVA